MKHLILVLFALFAVACGGTDFTTEEGFGAGSGGETASGGDTAGAAGASETGGAGSGGESSGGTTSTGAAPATGGAATGGATACSEAPWNLVLPTQVAWSQNESDAVVNHNNHCGMCGEFEKCSGSVTLKWEDALPATEDRLTWHVTLAAVEVPDAWTYTDYWCGTESKLGPHGLDLSITAPSAAQVEIKLTKTQDGGYKVLSLGRLDTEVTPIVAGAYDFVKVDTSDGLDPNNGGAYRTDLATYINRDVITALYGADVPCE